MALILEERRSPINKRNTLQINDPITEKCDLFIEESCHIMGNV